MSAMTELGPGSLTWAHYGDLRIILLGPWMVRMHSMWPPLGAAIEQTNNLLDNPMARAARSMNQVIAVVYGRDGAPVLAKTIRDLHRDVAADIAEDSPIDIPPGRYHSMSPDTFYWAHACFFMALIHTIECFGGGCSDAQRRQLFDEHVAWYRLYGVTMRPVPASWDNFVAYWCSQASRLQVTPTTAALLDMRPEGVLGWLARPALAGAAWIADGFTPDVVRAIAHRDWSSADERALYRFGRAVNVGMHLVPARIRWHGAALDALHGKRKGKLADVGSVAVAWSILTSAGILKGLVRR
jgi:uncharacterized protein (DUF2236 family)